jgi:hypothetical protein
MLSRKPLLILDPIANDLTPHEWQRVTRAAKGRVTLKLHDPSGSIPVCTVALCLSSLFHPSFIALSFSHPPLLPTFPLASLSIWMTCWASPGTKRPPVKAPLVRAWPLERSSPCPHLLPPSLLTCRWVSQRLDSSPLQPHSTLPQHLHLHHHKRRMLTMSLAHSCPPLARTRHQMSQRV